MITDLISQKDSKRATREEEINNKIGKLARERIACWVLYDVIFRALLNKIGNFK
jgi:hypothetical protein